MENKKTAIVLAAAGRAETPGIQALQQELSQVFPGMAIYLLEAERAGAAELLCRQLAEQGVEQIQVQPVYLLEGIGWQRLCKHLPSAAALYGIHAVVGVPLLHSGNDYALLGQLCMQAAEVCKADALVCVGHGTVDNLPYQRLETVMRKSVQSRKYGDISKLQEICVVTLQEWENNRISAKLQEANVKNICLIPLMMAAGKHTREDICGEGRASVKAGLEEAGFSVEIDRMGLTEYPEVRELLIEHLKGIDDKYGNFVH